MCATAFRLVGTSNSPSPCMPPSVGQRTANGLVTALTDGQLEVHSSSQHPAEVQHVVAHALGLNYNDVVCVVKRMGGPAQSELLQAMKDDAAADPDHRGRADGAQSTEQPGHALDERAAGHAQRRCKR